MSSKSYLEIRKGEKKVGLRFLLRMEGLITKPCGIRSYLLCDIRSLHIR